ncbi:MAG: sugar ABC transporter permease [Actinobacteria bacterium]|nr:sugar ABC transporter permease [Actinomycetota bacterium]
MTAPPSAPGARTTPAAAPPLPDSGGRGRRRGTRLADLAGAGPPMVLFCLFIIVPMIVAVGLSFIRWNGVGTPQWAGGSNWAEFFHDPVARTSVVVTAKVVVLSYLIQTPISMALGLFTAGRQRYRAVYAAIFVLPLLMSTAGIALMWESLLDPNFGALSALSRSWHLPFLQQNWLGDPSLTLYVVVGIIAWQFIPFHTLLYAVARRQIPQVLYEAAMLDGASPARTFWRVTLPQLRYTIVTSGILIIVGSLTYFDIIYIMTDGGPGYTTRVLSLDMYNAAFVQDQYGYASVLAVLLSVLGIAVAVGLVRFTGFASMASQQEGAT